MKDKKCIELSYEECHLIQYLLNCYVHEMPNKNLCLALNDINKKINTFATINSSELLWFDCDILETIYKMLNIEAKFDADLNNLLNKTNDSLKENKND